MCYLTTVVGSFHARVLAARLGAEGVLVVLKGTSDVYPIPSAVDVLVPADQLSLAREILLADAVDDAFTGVQLDSATRSPDMAGPDMAGPPVVHEPHTAGAKGDPSETYWLGPGPASVTGPDRIRSRSRLQGAPAVLVVVVVTMMVVAGCLAAILH
jgi:hypothetical protein